MSPSVVANGGHFSRARRVVRLLAAVVAAQSAAQVLGLLTGFLLLRWLDVKQYAEYTIAFGFSSTLTTLVDLGFSDSVMPLVGNRARDPHVFGAYMKAALALRRRVVFVVLPSSALAFFALADGRGWSLGVKAALFASVALTLLFRALVDFYAMPLLMLGKYSAFYGTQIWTSGVRLVFSAVLEISRTLTGWSASAVNALVMALTGVLYKRRASQYVALPSEVDPRRVREITHLVKPALPGLLFVAFQGQITIFLVAIFGHTAGIAQIGALSRFAQLFAVVGSLNQVLVGPRFAQLSREHLLGQSIRVVAAAMAFAVLVSSFAFAFPQPLLLLLGHSYAGLKRETGWCVLGAGVGLMTGVVYAINVSRRFVWWRTTIAGLATIVITEIACAAAFDLGSVLQLQYFAAVTAAAGLAVQGVTFCYGMRNGPRGLKAHQVVA